MTEVLKIIKNPTLTYQQKVLSLARLAENEDWESLPVTPEYKKAVEEGMLCDLGEGRVPYRPRYIIPDYELFMKNGSKTLGITPPTNLYEAIAALQILYHHVPSITSFPVYLGDFDDLFESFVTTMDREQAKNALRLFLLHIDKTLTDSFVHADIGPKDTLTGRIILELTEEMQLAIPNITLKYDANVTSDEFAKLALDCMLKTAKPSFANHTMFTSEWGEGYGIASCYNGLRQGGGGLTLHRIRLGSISTKADNVEHFISDVLPYYTQMLVDAMEDRVRFIVEDSLFFDTSLLAKEGLVRQENFTAMFGVVGLAECVNNLLGIEDARQGYGYNKEADQLAVRVMDTLEAIVKSHKSKYCASTNHQFGLHAQVGIDTDGMENSPGSRIPIFSEPLLHQQLNHSTMFHKYFPTGSGDVFKFDQTWFKSLDALLDIIKGAVSKGFRYFSGYNEDSDVVRVTGYLVKRSEIEKLDRLEQSLNQATVFGQGARDGANALSRRIHDEGSR